MAKQDSSGGKLYWDTAKRNTADGDMSGNLTSQWVRANGLDQASITLYAASATHVGTVAVDTTDDPTGTVYNTETLSSTPTAASGAAFNARVALGLGGAGWWRVRYTRTSGIGTLNGYYTMR